MGGRGKRRVRCGFEEVGGRRTSERRKLKANFFP